MTSEVTLRLGDVASVISGYAFKSSVFGDQGVPVIKIANIRSGYLDFSDTQKVDEKNFEKLNEKYRVSPGDILISLTGSHVTQPNSVVGRVAQAPQGLNKCLLNQRAGKVIVRRKDKCAPGFLYRYLIAAAAQGAIAAMASGAASQANVSPGQVESLPLVLPPLDKQQRIASILSAYDDLIANNTRRIEILEEMARRLYEEWFVRFRFPGHEEASFKESELGSIPKGWEICPVKPLVERLKNGTVYKEKDVEASGATIVIDQSRSEYLGFHHNEPDHQADDKKPIIIFGDHTCKMQIMVAPFSLGPNTIAFTGKTEHSLYYIFFLVKGLIKTREYKRHWSDFMGKMVVAAPVELSLKFGELVEPMFRQIELLRRKTRKLREQRDLLLPKLVSGEIDVSEIPMPDDKEVEAA